MAATVVIPPPSQLLGNARATEAWRRLVNRLVEGNYGLTSDSSLVDVQRAYLRSIYQRNDALTRILDSTPERTRHFNVAFNRYLADRGPNAPRLREDGTPYDDVPRMPGNFREDITGTDRDPRRGEEWRNMVERLRAAGYNVSDVHNVYRSFVQSENNGPRSATQPPEAGLEAAFREAHRRTGGHVLYRQDRELNPGLGNLLPETPPPRTERDTTEQPDGQDPGRRRGPGRQGPGRRGPGRQGPGRQGPGRQGPGRQGPGRQGRGRQRDDYRSHIGDEEQTEQLRERARAMQQLLSGPGDRAALMERLGLNPNGELGRQMMGLLGRFGPNPEQAVERLNRLVGADPDGPGSFRIHNGRLRVTPGSTGHITVSGFAPGSWEGRAFAPRVG